MARAVDDFKRDAMKALASYYAKPVGIGLAFVCALFLADVHGRRSVVTDQRLKAATDTVRITEAARAVAAETVTVRLKAQARIDTLVKVVSDTQVTVAHDTVTLPPLVVERIVTDDRTILSLRSLVVADTAVILALRHKMDLPVPRSRWGVGVSFGYSCGRSGCSPGIGVGLVWRF